MKRAKFAMTPDRSRRALMASLPCALLGFMGTPVAQTPPGGFDHRHAAWHALLERHVVVAPGGNSSTVRYAASARRRGAGDPTRAICSTLIAQAFQSVRYPILPIIENVPSQDPMCPGCMDEFLHVRHHSLFAPRDFDVSPYFAVIKPTLATGFDHHALAWREDTPKAMP